MQANFEEPDGQTVHLISYTFQNTKVQWTHAHHTGLYSIRKIIVNKFLLDKAHQQWLHNLSVFFLIVNRPWTLELFHFSSLLITFIALLKERKAPRNGNEIQAVVLNGLKRGWKEPLLPVDTGVNSKRKQPLNIHQMSTSERCRYVGGFHFNFRVRTGKSNLIWKINEVELKNGLILQNTLSGFCFCNSNGI